MQHSAMQSTHEIKENPRRNINAGLIPYQMT